MGFDVLVPAYAFCMNSLYVLHAIVLLLACHCLFLACLVLLALFCLPSFASCAQVLKALSFLMGANGQKIIHVRGAACGPSSFSSLT